MAANLGRLIGDYRSFVEACRARADELAISRLEIDRLGGLPVGYAAKLLGKEGAPRRKRMWPGSLEAMLGVLGLKIILVEDEAATARTLALRTPVQSGQQRFGSAHWRSAPALPPPSQLVSPPPSQPASPPPVSRAHLRVIQSKRVRKYA